MATKTKKEHLPVEKNKQPLSIIQTYNELKAVATDLFNSGMFPHITKPQEAICIIEYGREMGTPHVQALQSMFPINGKIGVETKILLSWAKMYGCDYNIKKETDEEVVIEFREASGKKHEVRFTYEEAQKLGCTTYVDKYDNNQVKIKKAWKGQRSNMLLQRCLSKAIRRFAPEVFGGGNVYTIEELTDGEATTVKEAKELNPQEDIVEAEYEEIPESEDFDSTSSDIPESDTYQESAMPESSDDGTKLAPNLQALQDSIEEDIHNIYAPEDLELFARVNATVEQLKADIMHRKHLGRYYNKGLKGDKRITPRVMTKIRYVRRRSDESDELDEVRYVWKEFQELLKSEQWRELPAKANDANWDKCKAIENWKISHDLTKENE